MLSVLVILLTAPIGAIGIAVLGPLWLPYDGTKEAEAAAKKAEAVEAAPAMAVEEERVEQHEHEHENASPAQGERAI